MSPRYVYGEEPTGEVPDRANLQQRLATIKTEIAVLEAAQRAGYDRERRTILEVKRKSLEQLIESVRSSGEQRTIGKFTSDSSSGPHKNTDLDNLSGSEKP